MVAPTPAGLRIRFASQPLRLPALAQLARFRTGRRRRRGLATGPVRPLAVHSDRLSGRGLFELVAPGTAPAQPEPAHRPARPVGALRTCGGAGRRSPAGGADP